MITNSNINAIINSDEIQSVLRDKKTQRVLHGRQRKNPLRNKALMDKLNPYQKELRAQRKKKIAKDKSKQAQYKEGSKKFLSDVQKMIGER